MDLDLSDLVTCAIETSELEPAAGYARGLFRKELNLSDLATSKLAGQTVPLGGGATIRFPTTCKVTVNLPKRLVGFSPAATAHVGGLMGNVDVHGLEIAPDWRSFKPLLTNVMDLITVDMV